MQLNEITAKLEAMIESEGTDGEWSAEYANSRCRRYAELVDALLDKIYPTEGLS